MEGRFLFKILNILARLSIKLNLNNKKNVFEKFYRKACEPCPCRKIIFLIFHYFFDRPLQKI